MALWLRGSPGVNSGTYFILSTLLGVTLGEDEDEDGDGNDDNKDYDDDDQDDDDDNENDDYDEGDDESLLVDVFILVPGWFLFYMITSCLFKGS